MEYILILLIICVLISYCFLLVLYIEYKSLYVDNENLKFRLQCAEHELDNLVCSEEV